MLDQDLSNFSMLDLFRMEVETQAALLNDKLLLLESQQVATAGASQVVSPLSESLMRAAHSIKGAARIVQIEPAVIVAHALEDCFVAAQQGKLTLSSDQIDVLLQGVDLLLDIAQVPETNREAWLAEQRTKAENLVSALAFILGQESQVTAIPQNNPSQQPQPSPQNLPLQEHLQPEQQHLPKNPQPVREVIDQPAPTIPNPGTETHEHPQSSDGGPDRELRPNGSRTAKVQNGTARGVRVSGEKLNRLMGLAGEALVEANWLLPFTDALQKLKRHQGKLSQDWERLQDLLPSPLDQSLESQLEAMHQTANECQQLLAERLNDLEGFARRSANLSDRLYREVIATQMRPFTDGVEGFPRMVRDLAKQLGKQINFEIVGKSTQVDREILEKLEAPLTHILRNAIDHGIESPEERLQAGKLAVGTVRLEAKHQAGSLLITVSDDGRGVDLVELRHQVVQQGRVSAEIAKQLTEAELMEFLFLPGFSTADSITEVSGRGVGLDIVQSMVQDVGGVLRAVSHPSRGMWFHLQLPLTLSVIRALLVEISGEAYAFILTRIDQTLKVRKSELESSENRNFITVDEQNIGLVAAYQVLELDEPQFCVDEEFLSVVLISDRSQRYGVVVDQFLDARDLVVRPLNPRLKIQDISAAALMEDGSIVLIVDVEDLVRSIDQLIRGKQLGKIGQTGTLAAKLEGVVPVKQSSRILVVDDSITVREVERKLLENNGYQVDVAVNGMDAWNAIRTNHYDLVITDVDMPRMNGIELVSQIKQNLNFKSLPVIIISYKDREEDYLRGLDVGANYYLTKSSFDDDTLIKAVIDLIGD